MQNYKIWMNLPLPEKQFLASVLKLDWMGQSLLASQWTAFVERNKTNFIIFNYCNFNNFYPNFYWTFFIIFF